MINVSILGATGYAGVELLRLLHNHKEVNIKAVSSVSFEGKEMDDVYKHLNNTGFGKLNLTNQDEAIEKGDVIFAALPHGLSEDIAAKCVENNKIFIDLGADFRLSDEEDYKEWYKLSYNKKELHEKSVYGLPELNREQIKVKSIIGNPGCYPTSISLALYPALKNKLINKDTVICDCKSGVTGAGRGLSQNTHFPDCNEAFSPYKIAAHRHIPEIEEILSQMAGEKMLITFVPHLLPVNRGILSTMYSTKTKDISIEEIHNIYKEFYKDENFVRVMELGDIVNINNIKCSNFCDISIHEDKRTNRLIIVSAIDNMVKGAAGQAIQNMNIRMGFDEKTGLDFLPIGF